MVLEELIQWVLGGELTLHHYTEGFRKKMDLKIKEHKGIKSIRCQSVSQSVSPSIRDLFGTSRITEFLSMCFGLASRMTRETRKRRRSR